MNIRKYADLFRQEITRKGYRKNSIDNYVSCLKAFLKFFDTVSKEPKEVKEMQKKSFFTMVKIKKKQLN